jgi:glycosyltransferase involved in cell wall biosynthesis
MSARVDVVVPAYNAAAYIEDALASVLAQGPCVASLIVVDDGSRDDTVALVEAFGARHPELRVTCLRQANAGPSAARNRGLAAASAEFVALLDADDRWHPDKLARQLAVFDAEPFPRLGVVYCDYGVMSLEGKPIPNAGFRLDPTVRGQVSTRLLHANLIAGSASAVLVRRSCLQDVGFFDDQLVCAEDWDLWLRLAQHYAFDYVHDVLVWLRQHPSNSQKNESRMLGGELLFLNKLWLAGLARWYHVARIRRRLVLGDYDVRALIGYERCNPQVQGLFTGKRMRLFAIAFRSYHSLRRAARRVKLRLLGRADTLPG